MNEFVSGNGYVSEEVVAVEFENYYRMCLAIKNDEGWMVMYGTENTPNIWRVDSPYNYPVEKEYRNGDKITITF